MTTEIFMDSFLPKLIGMMRIKIAVKNSVLLSSQEVSVTCI